MSEGKHLPVEFLRKWEPNGPWILTAISVEKTSIETKTFTANELSRAKKWIDKYNGTRNIYFHVNPCIRAIDGNKKAAKKDVRSLSWLHVDVDPVKEGMTLDQQREEQLNILLNPPGNIPVPTVIIFSGGGYQGFWKLKDPRVLNGVRTKIHKAEQYNIQLESDFNGDHCHNIDRIMRLPGTWNMPDDVKIKKARALGFERSKELAVLHTFDAKRVYTLDQFTPAPDVIDKTSDGFQSPILDKVGDIPKLEDVHALDSFANSTIPAWCKVVIVQGYDPDNPNNKEIFDKDMSDKWPSRSEPLFAVCCELTRCGVSSEAIYSVITDPGFGISASVLDKSPQVAEKYAWRQVERAAEDAIDPDLAWMNAKHAVIAVVGNKTLVISETYLPDLKRNIITYQSFEDLAKRYSNRFKEVGGEKPKKVGLAKWWLTHPNRREYETITFLPGKEVKNAYNIWQGFSYEAKAGDCQLYLDHVFNNVCSKEDEYYDYVMKWLARLIQFPANQGETALILRGKEGTGKGEFVKYIGQLLGRHYMAVSDSSHLVGNFNAHMDGCLLLYGDEAYFAGNRSHSGKLKAMITEEYMALERKGIDTQQKMNFVHVILASNDDHVIPAGPQARRYMVLDVGDDKIQDTDYFFAIKEQMKNGGSSALLHHLLTMDLKGFNVRRVPITKALLDQRILSLTADEEWWYKILTDGRLLAHHTGWFDVVRCDLLLNEYLLYTQKVGVQRRSNSTQLGRFLRKALPGMYPVRKQMNDREVVGSYDHGNEHEVLTRPYKYTLPALKVCRAWFDKEFGGPFTWPDKEEIQEEADF